MVHVFHGIARFRGVKSLKNKQGEEEDHLALEFAEKNILYLPMRDLHLVQRYIAFGKMKPELSRLGSKVWEKLKFDITFIGDDWFGKELMKEIEEKLKRVDVKVVYLPYTKNISSEMIRQFLVEMGAWIGDANNENY